MDYFINVNTAICEKDLFRFGFADVIESPFLQRLKGVSFLSTIDYIYDVEHRYSRFDHSLGCGYLALQLSKQLQLNKKQTEVLVLANLLHDIGHAPFSHASETFLLEKLRKYHEGVTSNYLRYNFRLSSNGFSLRDIFSSRDPEVIESVGQLIQNKSTNDNLVNTVYFCSTNCDKLDGTNRALFSLGGEYINPYDIIRAFIRIDDHIFFKAEYADVLERFWRNKFKLYDQYIYKLQVLSAEAMLTRALFLEFTTRELVNEFLRSTDHDAFSAINKGEYSSFISQVIYDKNFFVPLSILDKYFCDGVKNEFEKVRFDHERRLKLEKQIASRYSINEKYVISHFSFKKKFVINANFLWQAGLFRKNHSLINLEDINNNFRTYRITGDVFDVFIPDRPIQTENVEWVRKKKIELGILL